MAERRPKGHGDRRAEPSAISHCPGPFQLHVEIADRSEYDAGFRQSTTPFVSRSSEVRDRSIGRPTPLIAVGALLEARLDRVN